VCEGMDCVSGRTDKNYDIDYSFRVFCETDLAAFKS
jgi:hypothetical protein